MVGFDSAGIVNNSLSKAVVCWLIYTLLNEVHYSQYSDGALLANETITNPADFSIIYKFRVAILATSKPMCTLRTTMEHTCFTVTIPLFSAKIYILFNNHTMEQKHSTNGWQVKYNYIYISPTEYSKSGCRSSFNVSF